MFVFVAMPALPRVYGLNIDLYSVRLNEELRGGPLGGLGATASGLLRPMHALSSEFAGRCVRM